MRGVSQDGRSQLSLLSCPPDGGGGRWLPHPNRLAGPSSRTGEEEPLSSCPVGFPTGASHGSLPAMHLGISAQEDSRMSPPARLKEDTPYPPQTLCPQGGASPLQA